MISTRFYIILLIISCTALGDVTTHNSYFNNGGVVRETVSVHSMDYFNAIHIESDYLSGSAAASHPDVEENGSFSQAITFFSDEGIMGSRLKASAEDLGFGRVLSTGQEGYVGTSYFLQSGSAKASYFRPSTSVNEEVQLVNSRFQGNIEVWSTGMFSQGLGQSVTDLPSRFNYSIELSHMGKEARIDSFLNCYGLSENEIPVNYYWNTLHISNQSSALIGIDRLHVDDGDRYVEFGIKGTSDYLEDKYAPAEYAPPTNKPALLKPTSFGQRISSELYMSYQIGS